MKDFFMQILREAGKIPLQYVEDDFVVKEKTDPFDLLSAADVAVHEFITKQIALRYPDHQITSEEGKIEKEHFEYEWIIDPIDGTYNFVHGNPLWAVVLCVLRNGEIVYSGVFFPVSNQLYFADDSGAYLNNKKIHVVDTKEIKHSVASIQAVAPFGPYGIKYEQFLKAKLTYIEKFGKREFSYFSPADYMSVATGMFDFMASNAGLDWDKVPQKHICEKAGAVVTDSDGNPWQRGRQDIIISATPELPEQVLALFRE
ncbi:MAG: Inositol-phosphate phosphatase [Candidatus Magasanikbacteria bacterium GW2011_GWD2_43_18]|nr:MAG: Inositol-phosphate phosphatase [Candidatus Magasanikbacteria bacterium GW2011_GWC2_42_27]KKT05291.1 MAG: Inositol-phosphate phosphatase [Candidatus Magasanikbacteria bacterium GW2011_GWD2_43_18]KKT26087.1 MAG: Inositol-phosphate phosphatase [Candidatus Magasanikbacteria bacterium GW2011_GWA2_43_9]